MNNYAILDWGFCGSAVAVIPCTEVVLESDDGVSSCQSIEREKLFRTQTPHTYTLGELFDAHAEAGHKKVVFENEGFNFLLAVLVFV